MDVSFTALLDMSGRIIEALDPVSRIRLLANPISTEMDRIPGSSKTKIKGDLTAFSGVLRR